MHWKAPCNLNRPITLGFPCFYSFKNKKQSVIIAAQEICWELQTVDSQAHFFITSFLCPPHNEPLPLPALHVARPNATATAMAFLLALHAAFPLLLPPGTLGCGVLGPLLPSPLLYPLYSPFFSSLIMLGSDSLHQEGENYGSNIITKIIIVITLMVSPVSLGAFVVTITSHLLTEHVHPFVEQTRLLLCR